MTGKPSRKSRVKMMNHLFAWAWPFSLLTLFLFIAFFGRWRRVPSFLIYTVPSLHVFLLSWYIQYLHFVSSFFPNTYSTFTLCVPSFLIHIVLSLCMFLHAFFLSWYIHYRHFTRSFTCSFFPDKSSIVMIRRKRGATWGAVGRAVFTTPIRHQISFDIGWNPQFVPRKASVNVHYAVACCNDWPVQCAWNYVQYTFFIL